MDVDMVDMLGSGEYERALDSIEGRERSTEGRPIADSESEERLARIGPVKSSLLDEPNDSRDASDFLRFAGAGPG